MAETKTPRFTVKHVDGVMHLTIHPEDGPATAAASNRLHPQAVFVEKDER